MSDLFRNHIVGFPTRRLIVIFQKKLQLEELHTTVEDEEDDDYESLLKWRAPQHRQYLSHEVMFLACLYESTGRAIAVTPASALALALALASALLKMLKFLVKVFIRLYLLNI